MDNLKEELLQKKLKLHLSDMNEKSQMDEAQKDEMINSIKTPHSAKGNAN